MDKTGGTSIFLTTALAQPATATLNDVRVLTKVYRIGPASLLVKFRRGISADFFGI
jgi:hypothetical protein